jgi:tetratricopeptide (TPR) repeat protein
MLRSTVPSRLSRSLGLAVLTLALALPGCGKKKGEGTENPDEAGGKSAEQVKADIDKAKTQAKVSQLVELANKDLANGRYKAAAKLADQALAENPNNADAYTILGASHWRAGDFEASNQAYRKALELDPKNYGATLGLARNLQAEGKHLEAAALQDAVLKEEPEQLDPRLMKLWSYYAVCDADNAVKTMDEIFPRMGKDEQILPLVQAYAAFMRPFEGKGPLCVVEGDSGSTNLELDLTYGLKYSLATIGKEPAPAVFLENREEAVIDDKLAKKLGLKELAKYKPPGAEKELSIVLIPEVKLGKLSLKNIPATIQPLEAYTDATGGETPGVILGRQAIQGIGTITFDFPAHTLEVAKAAPTAAAEGEVALPMLLLSMHILHAPVVPISIDGSDHRFFVYLGYTFGSGLSISRKHYLKSGHLPGQLEPLDDPDAGLKMVYVRSYQLGDKKLEGTSGLVLMKEPPDVTLDQFVRNVSFEIGGHINLNLMATWRITYALGDGKVYIKP